MTNHTHKLGIVTACERCLIDRCRERDKLIHFLEKLQKDITDLLKELNE